MLKYDINSLCMIEDLKQRSFLSLINDSAEMEKFATIRLLFWAGLLHAHERLSMTEAGKKLADMLAEGKSLISIVKMINDAILACGLITMPDGEAANPPTV